MNPVQAVRSSLRQYAQLSGRARRSQYWYFVLFTSVVGLAAALVDNAIDSDLSGGMGIVGLVVSLALLLPTLTVSWRRMHDIGRPGTWVLLNFVPGIGWIVFIVLACRDSQSQANRFGASPEELVQP